jgi:hypothetical protein
MHSIAQPQKKGCVVEPSTQYRIFAFRALLYQVMASFYSTPQASEPLLRHLSYASLYSVIKPHDSDAETDFDSDSEVNYDSILPAVEIDLEKNNRRDSCETAVDSTTKNLDSVLKSKDSFDCEVGSEVESTKETESSEHKLFRYSSYASLYSIIPSTIINQTRRKSRILMVPEHIQQDKRHLWVFNSKNQIGEMDFKMRRLSVQL